MQQITVGTKNQIVIPKEVRQQVKGLKPGRKVRIYSLNEDTVAIKVGAQSWLDSSYGVMKNAWSSIDPVKELNKIREGW